MKIFVTQQPPIDFAITIVKSGDSNGGGGNPTAKHNNGVRSFGGRRCGGDQIHSRGCTDGGQTFSNRAIHRGAQ